MSGKLKCSRCGDNTSSWWSNGGTEYAMGEEGDKELKEKKKGHFLSANRQSLFTSLIFSCSSRSSRRFSSSFISSRSISCLACSTWWDGEGEWSYSWMSCQWSQFSTHSLLNFIFNLLFLHLEYRIDSLLYQQLDSLLCFLFDHLRTHRKTSQKLVINFHYCVFSSPSPQSAASRFPIICQFHVIAYFYYVHDCVYDNGHLTMHRCSMSTNVFCGLQKKTDELTHFFDIFSSFSYWFQLTAYIHDLVGICVSCSCAFVLAIYFVIVIGPLWRCNWSVWNVISIFFTLCLRIFLFCDWNV